MALSDLDVRGQYNGDGATVNFAIPGTLIFDDSVETLVYADDVLQTEGGAADYTLTGAPLPSSFHTTVTFNTAPASGVLVTICRVLTLNQTLDLVSAGSVNLATLEKHLDGIMAKLQQVDDKLKRAPKFKKTIKTADLATDDLALPDPVTEKVLAWNTAADALENVDKAEKGDKGDTGDTGPAGADGADGASGMLSCLIHDEKTSGTNAGSTTANTMHIRDLNTLYGDHAAMGITVTSNRVKFATAGTFRLTWTCKANRVGYTQTVLYDYTNSVVEINGLGGLTQSSSFVDSLSTGHAIITITTAREFEIQHYAGRTETNGLGTTVVGTGNIATNEVYVTLAIDQMS